MAYMRLLKKPCFAPGRPLPSHKPTYILSSFAQVMCQLSPCPPSRRMVSSSRQRDFMRRAPELAAGDDEASEANAIPAAAANPALLPAVAMLCRKRRREIPRVKGGSA